MKRFVPQWIKSPLRGLSDTLRREGSLFEKQGRRDVIHKAIITLDFNAIPGDYVEFGSCGAQTISWASEALRRYPRTPRKLWAFDSFAGLPPAEILDDEHPRWIAETMKMTLADFHAACRRKRVRNYAVVPGFFADSLHGKPATFFPAGSIAFAFIDCDIYSSTIDVCRFLLPRLQHGMILPFDDYWCYSANQPSGERRAFIETLQSLSEWRFEAYHSFGWSGASFVVERR